MKHAVTPVGFASPLEVETDDCAFCEAVRVHFKHQRGVVFFETDEPSKVQRVAILLTSPALLLACSTVDRAEMDRELA